MARDVKDALSGLMAPSEDTPPIGVPPGSLQLSLTPDQQTWATLVVLEDYDAAQRARGETNYGVTSKGETLSFDSWMKELTDLYFGNRIPKTEPWRFCSNRSMMIAMAILEVMHARIFPAIYNEELTRFRPGEATDEEKVERVEKLMFWWVRVRAKLREFFDRWTRHVLAYGRAMTVTTWDVQLMDKGERTPDQPQINPDGTVSVIPGQRVFDTVESTRSDLIPEQDVFLQPGARDVQRDTIIIRRKYLYRELQEMEANGQAMNIDQAMAMTSQSLKEMLPVLGAVIPQGATPQQEEEAKAVKRRNQEVEILEAYTAIDFDGDGFPEPVRLLVSPLYKLYLGGVALRDLSYRGMRHLDVTLYLPRLDDPVGQRGLGLLEQVKELALEIDAIFNQMTDANTLQVLRPGFYDPSGELDTGAMKLAPNKLTPVPNPQANVYFPDINIPTERLLNAIRLVLEFIERLTAASAYVMGKESEIVGGSGTATRVQAIVNAAGERHSIPIQRMREGAARIITQHLDLVQKYLPPGLEQRILGQDGEPVFAPNELSQQGIAGEFDAYLLPDDSLGSKESQRQLAQVLYEILTQNPLVATDPAKLYKVTADLMKAYGKDPATYLGPAPELNEARTPAEEHTLILQGDVNQVRATVGQNPIQHLLEHQAFLQDPAVLRLPPALQQQVAAFLQHHIMDHQGVMQLMIQAAQHVRGGGAPNATQQPGARPRGARAAAPVGPEPGVGSVRNPLAAARQNQGNGESATPA